MEKEQKTVDFNTMNITTDISLYLAEIKILSDFLVNSLAWYYQIKYTNKQFNTEDLKKLLDKYVQIKDILETVIGNINFEIKDK